MGKMQWVCTLNICPAEIVDLDRKTVTATLIDGQKIPIPIYILDYEHVKDFNPEKMLETYKKQNNLIDEEINGNAD